LKKNKAVIVFLLRFFISYIVLSSAYNWYLSTNTAKETNYKTDAITRLVANQTVAIANFLGFNFSTEQHQEELSYKLYTDNKYVARVVEGCNSISVIILFWAFIIAFAGKIKHTIIFGIVGALLIYTINLLRIVILTLAVDTYPEHTHFLHHIVFPAIIYSFTFVLWIVWVKYFASKKKA